MAERDLLVGALIREILGPRGGDHELMSDQEDPLDEYITGVLAPRSMRPMGEEASIESEVLGENGAGGDAFGGDAGPDVTPVEDLGPSLDPRLRASSMGISFAVRSSDGPEFDLAATWARYLPLEGGGWRRAPLGQVWRRIPCQDGWLEVTADPDVRIKVRARTDRTDGTIMRISVYLVNEADPATDRGARVHVFQPQLRLRCCEGTELVPLERAVTARNIEDRRLAVLYRERSTLARGHLCSATWADLDPERNYPGLSPSISEAPFHYWADGLAVWGQTDPKIVEQFSPADARTEYVPLVSVNAPAKQWREEFGPPPTLDPEALAACHSPSSMRAALSPLANGFSSWLDSERAAAEELSSEVCEVIGGQLSLTTAALERIRRGIDLICEDDDVRRSFCFANKAIALQSRWARRGEAVPAANHWYPFQLAFQLLAVPGLVDAEDPDRSICDLLWFPTGGGKTEAYLGLSAFTFALRRIRATRAGSAISGAGTAVLSRYTLRLLTIQQFRRAVALVTACELLRVSGSPTRRGWRAESDPDETPDLWGSVRFSIGLWVGGSVTPGNLRDFTYKDNAGRLHEVRGAFSLLRGAAGEGEPAQVSRCPCCDALLAVVGEGLASDARETLHLVFGDAPSQLPSDAEAAFAQEPFVVGSASLNPLPGGDYSVLSLEFQTTAGVDAYSVDAWVREHVRPTLGADAYLVSARGSRPGYFVRYETVRSREQDYDFEVFCGNPDCELASGIRWDERLPAGNWKPPDAFCSADGAADRCPIPIWTVDDQIYHRVPSMVVATVDKFARLAFEPKTAALFGNVNHHHPTGGWFRSYCPPAGRSLPNTPVADLGVGTVAAGPLAPLDLIIQDELHLIEGPLGSMVGLYETAVDQLASRPRAASAVRPKYVASTATVREAAPQVASLFQRDLAVFPVSGTTIDDSFFAKTERLHPLDALSSGRLYVGVCAPGRGAQTPLVRTWSQLLQHVHERRDTVPDVQLDGFWTLVGYFNAIRELAGSATLCRQDIPQRLILSADPRELDIIEELSSRTKSDDLPAKLDGLARKLPDTPVDVVLTTSMFGTGVDVPRLGLMFVAGQPKTTSSYIQATGRVGRNTGALVVTFLRASRPRDLNHYEYFVGYHDAIYRHVEPITVSPFAERARDHGLGPVAVALLRNAEALNTSVGHFPITNLWRVQQRVTGGWHSQAGLMATHRSDPEVNSIAKIFEERAGSQPDLRRPAAGEVAQHAAAELDRWHQLAKLDNSLLYYEPTQVSAPRSSVVLGDLAHTAANFDVAYENAPNSLREVESTTTFHGRA